MRRLHLSGVVLPEGEHRDLWVVDGVIRTEPVADAETVARNAFAMPGLVDAHCHVGLESQGAVSDAEAEQHALTERAAGALLLRDAGSPADTRWMDQRADLPKIIRAGRHIARPKRYLRNYGAEVEPDELVAEVERQAARGDGWIKLVGDWIDRAVGDLAPLWPADVAKQAIDRAHQLGCRVTAHVFGEQALTELVEAGIDGIEHGTGLSDAVTAQMAERQVALVPTMVQLENFETYAAAGEAKFPAYARHIRSLYATRLERFAKAREAGVPIYAGTDAGGFLPHGLVGKEMAALGAFSSPEYALGAGSWRARAWLGHPATARRRRSGRPGRLRRRPATRPAGAGPSPPRHPARQYRERVTQWICATCAVEHPDTDHPPDACAICSDERQYVRPSGQRWTTLHHLTAAGHEGTVNRIEPGLLGIDIKPSVGIGQRALLVQTTSGNLLWDPTGYVDDRLVAQVKQAGGVAAIAASHPHMFGVQVEWSRRFGDVPVYVADEDRQWLQRADRVVRDLERRHRDPPRRSPLPDRRALPRQRGRPVHGGRWPWRTALRRHCRLHAGRALGLVHAQLPEQAAAVGGGGREGRRPGSRA